MGSPVKHLTDEFRMTARGLTTNRITASTKFKDEEDVCLPAGFEFDFAARCEAILCRETAALWQSRLTAEQRKESRLKTSGLREIKKTEMVEMQ